MLSKSADSLNRKGWTFPDHSSQWSINLSLNWFHSVSLPLVLLGVLPEGLEGHAGWEKRAMPWKGRPSMQPSSACGWWIKPFWWQQNKWGLELWPAHPSQPPLRAAPSHIPLLLKVEIFPQHQLRSSFLQFGLVVSCLSALSHSFCCCNLSHHRNWHQWVLWIPWVLLTRNVGSDTPAAPWRLKSSVFPVSKEQSAFASVSITVAPFLPRLFYRKPPLPHSPLSFLSPFSWGFSIHSSQAVCYVTWMGPFAFSFHFFLSCSLGLYPEL